MTDYFIWMSALLTASVLSGAVFYWRGVRAGKLEAVDQAWAIWERYKDEEDTYSPTARRLCCDLGEWADHAD